MDLRHVLAKLCPNVTFQQRSSPTFRCRPITPPRLGILRVALVGSARAAQDVFVGNPQVLLTSRHMEGTTMLMVRLYMV